MHLGIFVCNIGAAVTGFLAAWFWFSSAKVAYPTRIGAWAPYGGVEVDAEPFLRAAEKTARLNRWAAGFSAAAALLVGISALLAGAA